MEYPLRYGFGFIARNREKGNFAAVAFSSAVSPEEVDIGVETVEAYRHHGLASYLAYRMCEEIILYGRRPVWAHAETNTGSQKTALSVGFKRCGINTVIHKKSGSAKLELMKGISESLAGRVSRRKREKH